MYLTVIGECTGCVKVREKICPLDRNPVAHFPSPVRDVPLVVVWIMTPLFVRLTVSPALIITDCGAKKKSPIETSTVTCPLIVVNVDVKFVPMASPEILMTPVVPSRRTACSRPGFPTAMIKDEACIGIQHPEDPASLLSV